MLVISLCQLAGLGQAGPEKADVPDEVLEKVVRRVMLHHFRPGVEPLDVFVADSVIDPDWLPEIRNVRFVIVPANKASGHKDGIYFFLTPEFSNGDHSIKFGRGDPGCRASGSIWHFQFEKNEVLIDGPREGWGSVCCYGSGESDIRPVPVQPMQ